MGRGNCKGGDTHIMWFTITSVLCPETDYVAETTLIVEPTDYTIKCLGPVPGADEYGIYRVYDKCGKLDGLTAEDLVGTVGWAMYTYPLTGYCEPRYLIGELCAQPECTDPEYP